MMVVTEAPRACTRKDKASVVNTSAPPKVQDALESSQANHRLGSPHPPERGAYITIDALKIFMCIMTETITR